MTEFWMEIPEKSYFRYKVEADTIEEAFEKHREGESEHVPFDEYYVGTQDPDEHSWIHLIDGSEGNTEQPYKFIDGQWRKV